MTASNPEFDTPKLQAHHAFLRRVALGLVGNPHEAEDVVQQAWISALGRERGLDGVGRGWLARAVRSIAASRASSERSRTDREHLVARTESTDTADVDQRLEHQALVLGGIRALPKPYRTVVFLRYYHDLGPGEIAARLELPLPTIKTRLARARELLRQELDRAYGGDRGAWLAAIVPALSDPWPSAPSTTGAGPLIGTIAMSTTTKLAAGLVAVTAVAFLLLNGGRVAEPERPGGDAAAAENTGETARQTTLAGGEATTERTAVDTLPTAASGATAPKSAAVVPEPGMRGRVLSAVGAPLGAVAIGFVAHGAKEVEELGLTAADGTFATLPPGGSGELRVAEDALVTLCAALVSPSTRAESVLIAARREALSGSVADQAGNPLSGVVVEIVLPVGFRSRFPFVMDNARLHIARAESEDGGSFSLSDGTRVEGAFLRASHEGYMTKQIPMQEVLSGIHLVLREPGLTDEALFGMVVDTSGLPVADARISFGGEVARSDETGAFQLQRHSAVASYDQLRADTPR